MKPPVMTLGQAKKLSGKRFNVGGRMFIFDDDIKAGGQAIAIPLKDADGKRVAFFRSLFAMAATPAKTDRTSWMIGQRLHLLSEAFMGAPQLWVNTEAQGRPTGVEFDFVGTIHGIALGASWKSWKEDIEMGLRNEPSTELRIQFAKGLIQRLACLEAVGASGFVHGDISDANVMLDDASGKANLIDFDCFVFESPTLQQTKLLIRDGGSKGTPGYIPEWLSEDTSTGLAPLGDRFARDMMLIEILGFREGDPIDLSPLYWTEQEDLLEDIKRLAQRMELVHLQGMKVFTASESERPSSFELAEKIGLPIENNVRQTLSEPPILPTEKPGSTKPESKQTASQSSKPALALPPIEIPSLEDLPKVLLKQTDRLAIALGKAVLPLLKMGIAGLLGIVGAVLWVLLFVYVMLNLSVPANLVVCGGMGYLTFIAIEKFKSSER